MNFITNILNSLGWYQAVLIALSLETVTDLLLRVVLRLQVIEPIAARHQEVFADVGRMHTEETVEHAVVDEWTRQQFLAERESEILNLPYRHRQSRREMSHEAEEVFIRYLPDTEESQHMIDTDGIEIRH